MNRINTPLSILCSVLLITAATAMSGVALAQGACTVETLMKRPEKTLISSLASDGRRALITTRDPDDGSYDVFELDLETGATIQVTDEDLENIVTSQGQIVEAFKGGGSGTDDLSRLLVTARADLAGENPNNALNWFVFDRASSQWTQVSNRLFDSHTFEEGDRRTSGVRLSPDGKTLAIEEAHAIEDELGTFVVRDIIVQDFETGHREQITFADGRVAEGHPDFPFGFEEFDYGVFSVDSEWLVIQADPDFSQETAFLYHIPTGQQEDFLAGSRDVSVVWLSAGAEEAIFISSQDWTGGNADGSFEIFHVNRSSGAIRQLTDRVAGPLQDFHREGITVSRDGSALSYQIRITDFTPNGLQTDRTVQELRWLDVATGTDVFIAHSAKVLVEDENGNQDFVGVGVLRSRPDMGPDPSLIYYDTTVDLEAGSDMPPDLDEVVNYRINCGLNASRFFPQIGDGVAEGIRFQSNIVLTNAGPATGVALSFFDSQGQPLEVELEGLGRNSKFEISVGQGRTLNLTTAGQDELKVGYAKVNAASQVEASAVFTRSDADSGIVQYEAGVPLVNTLQSFSLPVDSMGPKDTGVALVAAQSENATPLHLRLYDEDFQLLAEQEMTLQPGEHTARFVSELFPALAQAGEMRGTMTVSSPHPVAAVVLRQGDDPGLGFPEEVPTLTAFPVAEGLPEASSVLLNPSLR
ncbi:MAG TPA: hypothetical protein VLV83_07410 [Acidobacteriota bacterium]|nr:hypothetical protein [Acidobacteriota bacterium]